MDKRIDVMNANDLDKVEAILEGYNVAIVARSVECLFVAFEANDVAEKKLKQLGYTITSEKPEDLDKKTP